MSSWILWKPLPVRYQICSVEGEGRGISSQSGEGKVSTSHAGGGKVNTSQTACSKVSTSHHVGGKVNTSHHVGGKVNTSHHVGGKVNTSHHVGGKVSASHYGDGKTDSTHGGMKKTLEHSPPPTTPTHLHHRRQHPENSHWTNNAHVTHVPGFPTRSSQYVNTFKQQQRISFARQWFQDSTEHLGRSSDQPSLLHHLGRSPGRLPLLHHSAKAPEEIPQHHELTRRLHSAAESRPYHNFSNATKNSANFSRLSKSESKISCRVDSSCGNINNYHKCLFCEYNNGCINKSKEKTFLFQNGVDTPGKIASGLLKNRGDNPTHFSSGHYANSSRTRVDNSSYTSSYSSNPSCHPTQLTSPSNQLAKTEASTTLVQERLEYIRKTEQLLEYYRDEDARQSGLYLKHYQFSKSPRQNTPVASNAPDLKRPCIRASPIQRQLEERDCPKALDVRLYESPEYKLKEECCDFLGDWSAFVHVNLKSTQRERSIDGAKLSRRPCSEKMHKRISKSMDKVDTYKPAVDKPVRHKSGVNTSAVYSPTLNSQRMSISSANISSIHTSFGQESTEHRSAQPMSISTANMPAIHSSVGQKPTERRSSLCKPTALKSAVLCGLMSDIRSVSLP